MSPLRPARDLWQTTCSALRDGREPDWGVVADYRRPLLVFVARRFPNIDAGSREDLVHDVLLAIKESLHGSYDARKGRFRSFLCTVLANHVRKHLRSRRRERPALDEPLFDASAGVEVELVAEALGAVRRWLTAAGRENLRQVTVFSRQVGGGESIPTIAAAEDLPPSTVKRWLREARLTITGDLLERTLDLPPGLDLTRLARTALHALGKPPSARTGAVEAVADPGLREALASWVARLHAALSDFVRDEGMAGQEPLWAGLEGFLQEG